MSIIKEFEFNPEPKRFRLYKDDEFVFEASPSLSFNLVEMATQLTGQSLRETGLTPILQFFDTILFDESAAELRRRVDDKVRPFGAEMLRPVLQWLLEEYGLRPTEPSSPSSSTSPDDDGTSSTVGAQPEESNPSPLELPDSSISSTTT